MAERRPMPAGRNIIEIRDYAVRRGIRVAHAPLSGFTVRWSSVDRGVIVAADLPEQDRTEAIAHGIVHIEMVDFPEVVDAQAGIFPRGLVEGMVHNTVSRLLISLNDLVGVLHMTKDLRLAAVLLDVSEFLLHWRLDNLGSAELSEIPAEMLNRTGWVPGMGPAYKHTCMWPNPGGDELLLRMHGPA